MLEVQQAAMGSEARSRLDTMRAELGLPDPTTGELGTGSAGGVGSAGALGPGVAAGDAASPAGAPAGEATRADGGAGNGDGAQ